MARTWDWGILACSEILRPSKKNQGNRLQHANHEQAQKIVWQLAVADFRGLISWHYWEATYRAMEGDGNYNVVKCNLGQYSAHLGPYQGTFRVRRRQLRASSGGSSDATSKASFPLHNTEARQHQGNLDVSGVTPANQTKKGPKQKVHEFRPFLCILVFFLRKTSTNFCSGMPLWIVHELAFLWFGLPGPLLNVTSDVVLNRCCCPSAGAEIRAHSHFWDVVRCLFGSSSGHG